MKIARAGPSASSVVGESDDMASFLGEMYPQLVSVLCSVTGSLTVAEDLAQDALIVAWEQRERLASLDDPSSWVFRVALNRSRSWRRRTMLELRNMAAASASLSSRYVAPDDALELRTVLRSLPLRQRTVLVLRYYAGLPIKQTAEIMSCAEGTVKALTNQGLASLRHRLEMENL